MAQSQSVAHYISDSENDIDMEIQPSGNTETVKRKKQNRRKWIPLCTYNDKDDIINKIKNDGIWSKTHTNITSEGKRVYYRCNQVKWRGKQCPAGIHLLYHSENECITMYKTEDDHLHQESRSIGINQQSKEVICELFKMKIKPKHMLELLEEKGLPVPKKQQLSNYLTSLREKCYGTSTISLGELEAWCQQNSFIPDDDDKPWVLKYQIEYEDEINNDNDDDNVSNDDDDKNKFRFFVTTKRLLFNASISNKIHVDAIYKLIWQEFPCFIIGTTDMIKQFHPYGFAVCSNEKEKDFEFIFSCICDGLRNLNLQMNEQELVLIADGAEAISNAFSKVFGTDHNIVMCWFHMRKCVEKKLNLVEDKALHNEIMNDIETLQLSKNKKTFNIATRLFLKKWEKQERCIQYLSSEWLESKNGWYEGLSMYVPSTNNALEATNRMIKDEDTLRERLVLSRFTVVIFSIVNKWSKERNPTLINSKIFEHQPSITLSHWTDAYNWVKLNKEVISISNDDTTTYYLPAGEEITITGKEIKRYETYFYLYSSWSHHKLLRLDQQLAEVYSQSSTYKIYLSLLRINIISFIDNHL
ncbi:unnamed protein product [Rotaria sordida]|uniref:MULE transposase domain-containing protein n=1 Tax=Rotaria sordida TaxID=392033 RepID=A0A813YZC7_9BILA|nr:unnamed protein product [Rotaria sordida]CAF0891383.1 unnamed protein product [Rotaria sordida]